MRICVLGSGSSGNCTYVETEHARILIDAGLPYRVIAQRLGELGIAAESIEAIFVTHGHIDHIRSLGTFERLFATPIFAPYETQEIIERRLPGYPWNFYKPEQKFKDIEIVPFSVSHGKNSECGLPVNFVLYSKNSKYAHLTDLGKWDEEIVELVSDANCIHAEANYDERIVALKLKNPEFFEQWDYLRWVASDSGHLSNTQCAELLGRCTGSHTGHVFLAHLSENHRDAARDNNAYQIAKTKIQRYLKQQKKEFVLHRTYRRDATEGKKSDVVRI